MPFEDIEYAGTPAASKTIVPECGVAVSNRIAPHKAKGKDPAAPRRFITVGIGGKLARGIGLTQDEHKLRLSFGTGADAGKVRVSVDNLHGKFKTKRNKQGNYLLTINAATADGLFSTDFPTFTVTACEAVAPEAGGQRYFVFVASAAMLDVKD